MVFWVLSYCLDCNVLIQAKNGPYDFQTWPVFWKWLDKQFISGAVISSEMVYEEIIRGNDELVDWVKKHRRDGYFVKPDNDVQLIFGEIAEYVDQRYERQHSEFFLKGADPWVIALAKSKNSIVVTHETLVIESSKKVKIPNICRKFDVMHINLYEMMRRLDAKFE